MSEQLAADVLAVRDYIAEHGWCQGDFLGDDGESVCLLGAMSFVFLTTKRVGPIQEHLTEVIRARGDLPEQARGPITHFNDRMAKTTQDIMDFLDKAHVSALEKA